MKFLRISLSPCSPEISKRSRYGANWKYTTVVTIREVHISYYFLTKYWIYNFFPNFLSKNSAPPKGTVVLSATFVKQHPANYIHLYESHCDERGAIITVRSSFAEMRANKETDVSSAERRRRTTYVAALIFAALRGSSIDYGRRQLSSKRSVGKLEPFFRRRAAEGKRGYIIPRPWHFAKLRL